VERGKDPLRVVAFARGDQVVVEQTAAQFFQGRVLEVENNQLRVEVSGGRSVLVEPGDAYPLPPRKRSVPRQLAICRTGDRKWEGCRIESLQGSRIFARSAEDQEYSVGPDQVLAPSPLTELNLRRDFQRSRARADFVRAVEKAGQPRAPVGWKASPGERVLARKDNGWFTARVHEIEHDGLRVRWESDGEVIKVPMENVVPQPRYGSSPLMRGDFGLLRPTSLAEPWRPVQVRSVEDRDLRVLSLEGELLSTSAQDVVPLQSH
jgi:hypothetical protein